MYIVDVKKPHTMPRISVGAILENAEDNVAVSRYGRCQTMVMGVKGSGKTFKTIHDGLVRSNDGDNVLFVTDECGMKYKLWGMANYLDMTKVRAHMHYITNHDAFGCDYLSELIDLIIECGYTYVVFDIGMMSNGDWGKYNRILLRLNKYDIMFSVTALTDKKPVLLNRK